jgi:hypothetical protein
LALIRTFVSVIVNFLFCWESTRTQLREISPDMVGGKDSMNSVCFFFLFESDFLVLDMMKENRN